MNDKVATIVLILFFNSLILYDCVYTDIFQEVWGCVDARASVLCLPQLISTLLTETGSLS